MKVSAAEFVTSATAAGGFPGGGLPELALVGRSNVGKSSLINALVGRTIARTSAAPGKTRLANVYRVTPASGPAFHLIDLPGYGYARAPRQAQRTERSAREARESSVHAFEAITTAYFDRVTGKRTRGAVPEGTSGAEPRTLGAVREPFADTPPGFLAGVLLLVDSRHPGLPADRHAWDWLREREVPRAVVATKVDKLTRAERHRHSRELERIFEGPVAAVSAASGEGLEALWTQIAKLLWQRPPKAAHPPTPSR